MRWGHDPSSRPQPAPQCAEGFRLAHEAAGRRHLPPVDAAPPPASARSCWRCRRDRYGATDVAHARIIRARSWTMHGKIRNEAVAALVSRDPGLPTTSQPPVLNVRAKHGIRGRTPEALVRWMGRPRPGAAAHDGALCRDQRTSSIDDVGQPAAVLPCHRRRHNVGSGHGSVAAAGRHAAQARWAASARTDRPAVNPVAAALPRRPRRPSPGSKPRSLAEGLRDFLDWWRAYDWWRAGMSDGSRDAAVAGPGRGGGGRGISRAAGPGPGCARFEEALAARGGTADAVATSPCTTALHLSPCSPASDSDDPRPVPSLIVTARRGAVRRATTGVRGCRRGTRTSRPRRSSPPSRREPEPPSPSTSAGCRWTLDDLDASVDRAWHTVVRGRCPCHGIDL